MPANWREWHPRKDAPVPTFSSIQEAADGLLKHFVSKTRPGTQETIWTFKPKPPEWLVDMVREIHSGMLPDDHKYDFITSALYAFAYDYDDPDAAINEIEPDVYTSDLMEWFTSHLERRGYVDEAREEFGPGKSVDDDIMMGQVLEKQEVYRMVLNALENMVE